MTDLQSRRTALLAYAQSCLDAGDWHGLWDCAVDLAIIDARRQDRTMRLFDSRDVVQPWGKQPCLVCGSTEHGNNMPCPTTQVT